ncbi:MAG: TonB family protein [Deltaproteobacteria bacterium]|nr:TonB family protein [Deltaproteobacteria bacterium]
MYALRLGGSLLVSVVGHGALALYLQGLPELPPHADRDTVQIQVVAPPPPPEPEPEPPKPEPEPKPAQAEVHEIAQVPPPTYKPRATRPPPDKVPPKQPPPTERPATSGDTTDEPVFGVSMESTAPGASGPSVPVGNTLQTKDPGPPTLPAKVKPLAAPVAVAEVTRMPAVKGRCEGKYTDAAREAGVEGTVVIDLVIDEQGHATQISIVKGLGHGLNEAAIAAVQQCRFEPGEKAGRPVAVRLLAFKVRFFLDDDG